MNTQFFSKREAQINPTNIQAENTEKHAVVIESKDKQENQGTLEYQPSTTSHKFEDFTNFQSNSFEDHSKIQTITPSQSLLDFPMQFQSHTNGPQNIIYFHESQKDVENKLHEQINYLREENMIIKEELEEIKISYQQFIKSQQSSKPIYSNEDVNRLIEENRTLEEIQQKLTSERNNLRREINGFQQNLAQISNSNQELYKKVVSLTNQLERERREFRSSLKELQERSFKNIQQEQRRYTAMMEELHSEREENENLRTIIFQSNEQIHKLKSNKQQLEQQCQNLINQKQELKDYIESNQSDNNNEQIYQLRDIVDANRQEIVNLNDQLQKYQQEYETLMQECSNWKNLYEKQLIISEQSQQIISNLKGQLQRAKKTQRPPFFHHPSLSTTHPHIIINTNPKQKMNKQPQVNTSCSASTSNRLKVLCQQTTRKKIMQELKRLIKDIARVDLENKITSLVHQLYMDAQYRERTNLQMQEIIVQLQNKIAQQERPKFEPSKKVEGRLHANGQSYISYLQESLSRYERLLLNADSQKLKLIDELALLKRQNYQVRLELANSQLDNQTEELIEQLTLQLQQEKHTNKTLEEDNEQYKNEIISIEKELNQKNKRIKLLMLNLNKKLSDGQGRNQHA